MSDVSEEPLASLANNILHLTSDIWHLVASERDHWVYLRRPPRRNPTGYERHEDQQQCNDSNGQGISHADSKKLFSHSRLPRPAPERLAVQQTLQAITDRKSTRLNSSHVAISYAVFCLKKKNT